MHPKHTPEPAPSSIREVWVWYPLPPPLECPRPWQGREAEPYLHLLGFQTPGFDDPIPVTGAPPPPSPRQVVLAVEDADALWLESRVLPQMTLPPGDQWCWVMWPAGICLYNLQRLGLVPLIAPSAVPLLADLLEAYRGTVHFTQRVSIAIPSEADREAARLAADAEADRDPGES